MNIKITNQGLHQKNFILIRLFIAPDLLTQTSIPYSYTPMATNSSYCLLTEGGKVLLTGCG
jgi:hypothetical protein